MWKEFKRQVFGVKKKKRNKELEKKMHKARRSQFDKKNDAEIFRLTYKFRR